VESGVESVDGMTYFENEGLMVVRVSVRHFSVVRVSVRGRIAQKNGLWLVEFHRKKSPSGHRISKQELGPIGSLGIDHFAIFALAQNEVTMKYVFWGEKAWTSSALLLISTS
jgi:hypothetical protein